MSTDTMVSPGSGKTKSESSPEEGAEARRRYPIGAEILPGGGVSFRVWAPKADDVILELFTSAESKQPSGSCEMNREQGGYFSVTCSEAAAGTLYRFRIGDMSLPDPVSRFQPTGPHGHSQVVDGTRFSWSDEGWAGVPAEKRVVYELHVGTFTPEGTWASATKQLPELSKLGVTLIEMMPVADFPGNFGWGYDGVNLFSPCRLYGNPDDLRAFVDRAHQLGIGVILDVVYNHLGPDGNYLPFFSEDYFSKRYKNEWGEPLNFDGQNSAPVREFFVLNAQYWIEEFHMDGLRFDATQQMFDSSKEHILGEISRKVRECAPGKSLFLVGENESQHTRLVKPLEQGGLGLDSLWNDDLHHSLVAALTGKREAYYTDYLGNPQEFISAFKYGYLYQGQWYAWQKKNRGHSTRGLCQTCFVNYMENHDQVANTLRGQRLRQLSSPGTFRALTTLFLLGPGIPMLFQGQEFGASSPFTFFADHNPELARLVYKGRKEFLDQFPSIASPDSAGEYPTPEALETFLECKLKLEERELNSGIYALHIDLLRLRREDAVFSSVLKHTVDGAVLGTSAFVLRFMAEDGSDRAILVNLGVDLPLSPLPEPLLAPGQEMQWRLLFSSDHPKYGGPGWTPLKADASWVMPGQCAIVLESVKAEENLSLQQAAEP